MENNYSCLLLLTTFISASSQSLPADEALARLMKGNQRYVRHKEQHPDQSMARRKELDTGQHPFAVILGCADSRVSPELLFDQGSIRHPRRLADPSLRASVEESDRKEGIKGRPGGLRTGHGQSYHSERGSSERLNLLPRSQHDEQRDP